jgi:hypothetical protein
MSIQKKHPANISRGGKVRVDRNGLNFTSVSLNVHLKMVVSTTPAHQRSLSLLHGKIKIATSWFGTNALGLTNPNAPKKPE